MLVAFYRTVFRPVVRDSADVRRYVIAVTLFAWLVAVCADIAQHALQGDLSALPVQSFFTLIVVLAVAVPISRTMGRAHLNVHLARQEAERLSRTDPLTGLPNRRAFYDAAAELKGGTMALAIADIDRFKRINDRHGHAAGDAALVAVAKIMHDALSDLGVVARLGGEEFGLLSAESDAAKVKDRLQAFRERVADAPIAVGGEMIAVTVSAGFAVRADAEMDALYSAADRALYVAKSAGRDRVVAFDEIETGLAEALLRQAG
jgi:diguanylate cyclase (GGDEF)-like protein